MAKPIIYDGETQREMTDTEFEDWQILCADLKTQAELAQQNAAQTVAAEKTGRAKLKDLGLTDSEIEALLGVSRG